MGFFGVIGVVRKARGLGFFVFMVFVIGMG